MFVTKSHLRSAAKSGEWLAIAMLLALPAIAAADFGGVLPWTFWAVSVAMVVVLVLAIPGRLYTVNHGNLRDHSLAILLFAIAIYGFLQTVPLPASVLAWVASGSHEAYTLWLSPLAMASGDATLLQTVWPRISVDASLSRTASWTMIVVAVFSSLSSLLIADRNRIQFLLVAIAISGAAHASLGIYQMLSDPTATIWGVRSSEGGAPFGAYINRSNAAVMLNSGFAGSIGLIAWRLAALTGATLNGAKVPLSELLDVFFDKVSVLAIITGSTTIIGLLICGSRSGLVGLVGGLMLAFGIVQSAHRARGLLPTIAGLGIIAAIAIANFDLSARSTERVGNTLEQAAETATISDGRFSHWPDAFTAAWKQPLVGWGWGAYRYAYLPFQKTSASGWFINADNLWLEVFVETGLLGIILVAAAIYLIIKAVIRLDYSADPIDHGLASAGWFLLGALMTSQFFDFGLRIPGNSLLVASIFAVIVSRSRAIGMTDVKRVTNVGSDGNRFRLPHDLSFTESTRSSHANRLSHPMILSLVLILISFASASAFYSYSTDDYAIRAARSLNAGRSVNAEDIQHVDALLTNSSAAKHQNAAVLIASSQVKLLIARHQAATEISKTEESLAVEQIFDMLSPGNLRRFSNMSGNEGTDDTSNAVHALWYSLGPTFPSAFESTVDRLRDARESAVKAIVASPLSPEARLALISLDFVGGDRQQSMKLLEQVALLRRQSPLVLVHVGDLAAEMHSYPFAATCWKRAAHINPRWGQVGLVRASRIKQISANDVTPDTVDAMRLTMASEVRKSTPDRQLLLRGIRLLGRTLPNETVSKAEQLTLIAQAQIRLNLFKDAAATLTRATAVVPGNVEIRYQHTRSLIAAKDLVAANESARIGQQIAPNDQRFEKLIQDIARNIQSDGKL